MSNIYTYKLTKIYIYLQNTKYIAMNRFRQQESPLDSTVALIYVYSPPKHQITIKQYTKFFNHLGLQWVLGDDFNSKRRFWGSKLGTSKGRRLLIATDRIKAVCFSKGQLTCCLWIQKNHQIASISVSWNKYYRTT